MSESLRISLLQFDPKSGDVNANLQRLTELLQGVQPCDLLLLPEMFATGFNPNAPVEKATQILDWMRKTAAELNTAVCGTLAVEEKNRRFNRLFFVKQNDEQPKTYDKHHLFSLADEAKHFTPGTESPRFELNSWNIKPIICYDLRFPEWCRNSKTEPYDLLICPASWPTPRKDAWTALLRCRAIENQAYVAGVNRVGADQNNLAHSGLSVLFNPRGEVIAEAQAEQEMLVQATIELESLRRFRARFPILQDMD